MTALETFWLQDESYSVSGAMHFSMQRIAIGIESYGFYFLKVLFPVSLALDYGRSFPTLSQNGIDWGMIGAAFIMFAVIAVYWRRASTIGRFGVICFLLAQIATSGVIPFGFEEISINADRYMYFPMFGLSVIAADLFSRVEWTKVYLWIGVGVAALTAVLTWNQSRAWISDFDCFTNVLKVNPHSAVAHHSLGGYFAAHKQFEPAIENLTESLKENGSDLIVMGKLVSILTDAGKTDAAKAHVTEYLSNTELLKSFAGTVQVSIFYAAVAHYYLIGASDALNAYKYYCESLKNHYSNMGSHKGMDVALAILQQKNVSVAPCFP